MGLSDPRARSAEAVRTELENGFAARELQEKTDKLNDGKVC